MNENCQEWYNTTSKDKVERIALWNARWRILELLKTRHVLSTMFIFLSIAWRILAPSEILKNKVRMKEILDEPSCRASMKNSGNKRITKRKISWKHEVKTCNDLDGASRRDKAKNLKLRKRKDEASRTEKCDMMNNDGKKKLDHLDETIIRITLCVSFTNLNWWQATDLAYYLFS